jgi:RES domain-containing protein
VLTSLTIIDPHEVHVVDPTRLPNPNWLRPGIPGAGQQAFGDGLMAGHPIVLLPSAVSTHSWNLIFNTTSASGLYALASQEPFALDTRLHPPAE